MNVEAYKGLFGNTIVIGQIPLLTIIRSCPFDLAMAIRYYAIYRYGDGIADARLALDWCDCAGANKENTAHIKRYEKWYRKNSRLLLAFFSNDFALFNNSTNVWDFIDSMKNSIKESEED